jgi:hypothetical protein
VDNKRREFLFQLGALSVATPALGIFLSGCETANPSDDDTGDDDDDSAGGGEECSPGDAEGPANAHSHILSIPAAHLEDPIEDRTYTSSGGTHVHTFTVSAAQLEELRDTCSLTLETTLPHAHTWAVEIL